MDFIFDLLDASATACYAAITALFVYHLVNCWQRTVPSPVPAIATTEATVNIPTALPAPSIAAAPMPIVPSTALEPEITPTTIIEPESTPIADVATTSTVKHRRQVSPAKGFGNKSTQTKQRSKRQPVNA